jgi:putative nucleotidyltransferase with HDIG domain
MNISEALKKRGQVVLHKLFDDVQQGRQVVISDAEQYIVNLIDEIIHQKEAELVLFKAKTMDDYTLLHTLNVTFLSLIMAFKMGIEGQELKEIGLGALLHDIGKINTPSELQWKQTPSNDYEANTLSEHPFFGAHWMTQSAVLSEEVVNIIKTHHETFNGKGYPTKMTTRDLPRSVHIVSICNFYDYLVSDHNHKKGTDSRTACFMISKESGKKFSPKIVGFFYFVDGPNANGRSTLS